jgi:hypothetical protein
MTNKIKITKAAFHDRSVVVHMTKMQYRGFESSPRQTMPVTGSVPTWNDTISWALPLTSPRSVSLFCIQSFVSPSVFPFLFSIPLSLPLSSQSFSRLPLLFYPLSTSISPPIFYTFVFFPAPLPHFLSPHLSLTTSIPHPLSWSLPICRSLLFMYTHSPSCLLSSLPHSLPPYIYLTKIFPNVFAFHDVHKSSLRIYRKNRLNPW